MCSWRLRIKSAVVDTVAYIPGDRDGPGYWSIFIREESKPHEQGHLIKQEELIQFDPLYHKAKVMYG